MKLAAELKRLLVERGMTVTTLARKSSVPKQTITDWLAGREPRRLTQVKLVADALGVTVDELAFGAAPPTSENMLSMEHVSDDGWLGGVFEVRIRPVRKTDGKPQ